MKNFLFKLSFQLLICCAVVAFGYTANAQNTDNENTKNVFSKQDLTLSVYPIPAKTIAYVHIPTGLRSQIDRLEVVNIIGKRVMSQPIIDKSTSDVVFNNISDLSKGLYVIIARDKSGKILQSAKLMVSND